MLEPKAIGVNTFIGVGEMFLKRFTKKCTKSTQLVFTPFLWFLLTAPYLDEGGASHLGSRTCNASVRLKLFPTSLLIITGQELSYLRHGRMGKH